MKILLVGCGFIGHHIARKVLSVGHKLDIITKNPLPQMRNLNFGDMGELEISYAENWHNYHHAKYDAIIYTASTANAVEVKHAPSVGSSSIIDGPINILLEAETKHFIYLSSSMVYGNFNGLVPRETDPLNPIEPYGMMKAASEELVKFYCKDRGVDYTIIRPSAVYGPRDVIRRVLSIYIDRAIRDEELLVKGDISLDFTYVDDLVEGIVSCLHTQNARNEIFNMTRGEAIPLFAAASMVIKELGKGRITGEEADSLYPSRGALDISKAQHMLGYDPKTSLREGIKKYIDEWIK